MKCVKNALEKGKHVICEKPFTSHVAELIELAKLAKEKSTYFIRSYFYTIFT